jgi:hypothetical protein
MRRTTFAVFMAAAGGSWLKRAGESSLSPAAVVFSIDGRIELALSFGAGMSQEERMLGELMSRMPKITPLTVR